MIPFTPRVLRTHGAASRPAPNLAICVILLVIGICSSFGAPQLSVGNTNGVPGASVSVATMIASDTNVVAVQYDIVFNPATLISTDATAGGAQPNHQVASALVNQSTRRMVLYSPANAALTNGVLANLVFTIASNAPPGVSSLLITNAIFANAQGNQVQPGGLASGFVLSLAAPARFGSIFLSTNGAVQFQVFGSISQAYVIQASTNLLQWINVSTNTSLNGEIDFTDNNGGRFGYRFYRVKLGQ
jgi:Cohesin domain